MRSNCLPPANDGAVIASAYLRTLAEPGDVAPHVQTNKFARKRVQTCFCILYGM